MEHKEFFDNHQIELVSELEISGLILAVYDIKNLGKTIKKAGSFIPDFGKIQHSSLQNHLKKYIAETYK